MTTETKSGIYVFDTQIGHCGFAWKAHTIDHFQLPEEDAQATRALLCSKTDNRKVFSRAPKPFAGLAKRVRSHLKGNPDSFKDIKVDPGARSEFTKKVYAKLRTVKPGKVVTYGQLAKMAGSPKAARAVGSAMASNPIPLIIPCHRVITSDRKLGGFSAHGGIMTKAHILFAEGVVLNAQHKKGMEHLGRVDKKMKQMIARMGPYLATEMSNTNPYESLVQAIIYQQLSYKAAASIANKFRTMYGEGKYPNAEVVTKLSEEQLRKSGISIRKAGFIKGVARHALAGKLNLAVLGQLDDEQVISSLCEIKGIGRWSAQMFLLFNLGRLDVWPVDDLGLQNALVFAYGLSRKPNPATMEKYSQKWKPYRSMAAWYLWKNLAQANG